MDIKPIYYSKELIEMAKKNLFLSSPVWHKIMNPNCGACAYERGQLVLRDGFGK